MVHIFKLHPVKSTSCMNCAVNGWLLNVLSCRQGAASLHRDSENQGEEEEPWLASGTHSSRMTPKTGSREMTYPFCVLTV